MYPAIKTNAIGEKEAREQAGNEAVDAALKLNCDFTNRLIDEVYEVYELSASVDIDDDRVLTVLYLVDKAACDETEDMGSLDYSDYTFTID